MDFLKLILYTLFSANWRFSSAFSKNFDEEFTKDITSIVVESTLTSKCNANIFMTSKNCGDYISNAVQSLSPWAPPVLVTSFDGNTLGLGTEGSDTRRREQWTKFLAAQRKTCSLVLICDLSEDFNFPEEFPYTNDSFTNTSLVLPVLQKDESQIPSTEFLSLRKFITIFDHILYVYNPRDNDGAGLMGLQTDYGENAILQNLHNSILKHSGILLSLEVENRSLNTESLLRVFSKCNYCGTGKQSITDLGNWQRNKTQFSKFFPIFDRYAKANFNGYNMTVGYFKYPPHFSVAVENGTKVYSGVEWQMLSQMSKSLNFRFHLIDLTQNGNFTPSNNITSMTDAIRKEYIELALGGISVTPERKTSVDFSKIFSHEPIVFVVAKRSDIYILGIWLAFQPQVWPIIIILILIMAFLFRTILRKPSGGNANAFLSNNYLYFLLKRATKGYRSIGMFRALEITLTPLLGQSLSQCQIKRMPSRLIKLLLGIWWFSCLIISTLYNTSLITSLINPVTPKEPESLQDLIHFGYEFKLGCKPGVAYELITSEIDSKSDTSKHARTESTAEERANLMELLKQIQSRLTVGSTKSSLVAYVVEESSVDEINWNSKEIGFSSIKVIRERLFLTWYGWPLQRAAPYKEKIDTALGRLASAGLIDYWYLNFSHKEKEPTDGMFKLRKKIGQIHLNMEVLQGAFLFLFLGCGVAAIAFAVENFKAKYSFRFFTKNEFVVLVKKVSAGIAYYFDKISGGHRNRVVFVQNEGNTPLRNHKFREAVLEIVNIRKSYPFMK